MKRSTIGFLAVLVGLGLAATHFAFADEARGPRPGAPGMSRHHDYGPGQGHRDGHGAGAGQMGRKSGPAMGFMMEKLSPEKREQVRKSHLEMRRRMIAKRAEIKGLRLDLGEIMHAFPIDQAAASSKFDALAKVRGEIFALRMAAMASTQRIVGKELWEQAHAGRGMGNMRRGGMGGGRHHR